MKFYAVAHITNRSNNLQNAERAVRAGADGVFFINHGTMPETVLDVASSVNDYMPDLWIGVNMLGYNPKDIFRELPRFVKGLWVDNARTPFKRGASDEEARSNTRAREASGWQGEYFGGVAFKYQKQPDDVKEAASLAVPFVDVITTSGSATGYAPDPEKIRAMREGAGHIGLAIASGIDSENVMFYHHATHVLVATGVSDSFDELSETKMRKLVEKIRTLPT